MSETQYFEYTAGAFPNGTPRPINHITVPVAIPTMAGGQIVGTTSVIEIEPLEKLGAADMARIVPGTRFVEAKAAAIINHLLARGDFLPIDPPKKAQIDQQVKEAADDKAHRDALTATAAEQEDAPVSTGAVAVPADVPTTDDAPSGEEA